MEFFREVKDTFKRMDERLGGLREDVQALYGAFAGIEAMLIANAATQRQQADLIANLTARVEALEKRAS